MVISLFSFRGMPLMAFTGACELSLHQVSVAGYDTIDVMLHPKVLQLEPVTISGSALKSPLLRDEIRDIHLFETRGLSLTHSLERLSGVRMFSTGHGIAKPVIGGLPWLPGTIRSLASTRERMPITLTTFIGLPELSLEMGTSATALSHKMFLPHDLIWESGMDVSFQQNINHPSSARRPPSPNELYANGLHQGVAGIENGNPDFHAERSANMNRMRYFIPESGVNVALRVMVPINKKTYRSKVESQINGYIYEC